MDTGRTLGSLGEGTWCWGMTWVTPRMRVTLGMSPVEVLVHTTVFQIWGVGVSGYKGMTSGGDRGWQWDSCPHVSTSPGRKLGDFLHHAELLPSEAVMGDPPLRCQGSGIWGVKEGGQCGGLGAEGRGGGT